MRRADGGLRGRVVFVRTGGRLEEADFESCRE